MTRQQSAIIKGIAILLMMLYHLPCISTIPGIDDSVYPTLARACHPIQYFLMISGYGLYLAYKNGRITWSYLLKRSVRLYISFWLVLLVFVFGIGTLLYPERFPLSWDYALTNLVGLRWDYCQFTWVILPYILMTFCSPVLFLFMDRMGNTMSLISGILLYLITGWLISRHYNLLMNPPFLNLLHLITLTIMTFLSVILGAVMARIMLSGHKLTWAKLEGKNLLIILVLIVLFIVRCQIETSAVTFIFISIVVWLVLHLRLPQPVSRVFESLGDKSMMMWFLHGFLAVQMFSEYVALLRWPLVIWIVWVIICYGIACLLMPVSNRIAKSLRIL
jgi:hypothetical protein